MKENAFEMSTSTQGMSVGWFKLKTLIKNGYMGGNAAAFGPATELG